MSGKPRTVVEWRQALRRIIQIEQESAVLYQSYGMERSELIIRSAEFGMRQALELASEVDMEESFDPADLE